MSSACGSGRSPRGRRGIGITGSRGSGSNEPSGPTRAGCCGAIGGRASDVSAVDLTRTAMLMQLASTLEADHEVLLTTRRTFIKLTGLAGSELAIGFGAARGLWAQIPGSPPVSTIQTAALTIGYEDSGNPAGFPILLLHGFPDDVRAFDGVVPPLAKGGYRVLVPYLRGYGPTR